MTLMCGDCDEFDIHWIAMIWKGVYWIVFGLDLIGDRMQKIGLGVNWVRLEFCFGVLDVPIPQNEPKKNLSWVFLVFCGIQNLILGENGSPGSPAEPLRPKNANRLRGSTVLGCGAKVGQVWD